MYVNGKNRVSRRREGDLYMLYVVGCGTGRNLLVVLEAAKLLPRSGSRQRVYRVETGRPLLDLLGL
jgi:hypothetical protein